MINDAGAKPARPVIELRLRRSCPGHHDAKERDRIWAVDCDGVYVGSIALHQGRSDSLPVWQWVVHLHDGRFGNGLPIQEGSAETRELAMAAFRKGFERCREYSGAEGWQHHCEHMAMVSARAEAGRKY